MCVNQVGTNSTSFQEKLAESLALMGREVEVLLKSELIVFCFEPEVEEALAHGYGAIWISVANRLG